MNLYERIFDVSPYLGELNRARARLIYIISFIMVVALSLYFFFIPDWGAASLQDEVQVPLIQALNHPLHVFVFASVYVLYIAIFLLTRRGYMETSGWLIPLVFYVGTLLNALIDPINFSNSVPMLTLVAFILLMGFFKEYKGLAVALPVVVITYVLDPGDVIFADLASLSLLIFGIFILVTLYLRFTRISRMEAEGIAGQERLRLAEITTAIARKASERPSLEVLLNYALALIRDRYPQFYHVQVFLIDDKRVQARLAASTGEAGRILMARAHALTVGSLSVIGQVTFRGEPIIAYADANNTIHRPNDVLPRTRTEVAFAMRIQEEIIGALDLQSLEVIQLGEDEKQILQSLADSLALAIDNVRQYENARARALENQRLAEQARSALNEVQRLNKRLIGRAWSDYLKDRGQYGLEIDLDSNQSHLLQDSTPALDEAISERKLIQHGRQIALPLQIRDQVIGALEFEVDDAEALSDDDLEMLREVTQRLGLAAENARLVEESQRSAQREALINELSSRLQSANTVETTLTEAARGLRETLRAERIIIRLGSPPKKTEAQS
ncbi:MAG: GAF domain-containing protein [Anaerolineae bacterium]|nr:GAF domain-containing protein [Anaerolineae bacterium]MDW8173672.1 GAF domain-containing protein [Anaerolineae bacterium]